MAAKKKTPLSSGKKQQNQMYIYGAYAILLAVWAYILASMAIDNGSLIFYAFSIISIYWAVHFAKRAFRAR